jgi:hypothetical protein
MSDALLRILFTTLLIPAVLLADNLDDRLRADDVSFAPRNGGRTQIHQLLSLLEQGVQQNDISLLSEVLASDIESTLPDDLPAPLLEALQSRFSEAANAMLTVHDVISGWDITGFRNFDFGIDSIQFSRGVSTAWLEARWPYSGSTSKADRSFTLDVTHDGGRWHIVSAESLLALIDAFRNTDADLKNAKECVTVDPIYTEAASSSKSAIVRLQTIRTSGTES